MVRRMEDRCNSEVNGDEPGNVRTHLREGTKVFTKGYFLCTEFSQENKSIAIENLNTDKN